MLPGLNPADETELGADLAPLSLLPHSQKLYLLVSERITVLITSIALVIVMLFTLKNLETLRDYYFPEP